MKNYFLAAFITIIIAIGVFCILKYLMPKSLFSAENDDLTEVVVDSMALQAMSETDSGLVESSKQMKQVEEIILPSMHTQGYTNLLSFYSKIYGIETTKKGKVRVAYFGDSMTDGDLIVQDIRSRFQDNFGGEGVGFVGMTSLSAASRLSVSHKYSKNWQTCSYLNPKKSKFPFGIDGQVSTIRSSEPAWLKLSAGDVVHLTELCSPTLFYGRSDNNEGSISVKTEVGEPREAKLTPGKILNTAVLSDSPVKNFTVNFYKSENIPFYGVNIDNENGVYVDNFSMRGNSGLPMGALDKELLCNFDSILNYDLIVLHYGANLLGYKSKDFGWYEKKMNNVVLHLRECFPNADFLIISTADRALKYGGEMKTDRAVSPLITAQRTYAKATNCCFIDMLSLMGGEGSMVKWVNGSPSLANKDYTHFNIRGSRKIADLLYGEINGGYEKFKQLKQEGKIK
ncbi:hypothetical protein [Dysgonomonas sp. 520]|uniref:hypothetical protein n=1 Tax=Dysgonomonas sp. 520 TaxID=2302931 RepID=UPI00351A1A4E